MTTQAPRQRAHWHEAYDAQIGVWRWYRTPAGMRWMGGSYRANADKLSESTSEMIYRLYDGEMGRLINCDPIYVSEEMCELVDAARQTFQPEPLLDSDLITPRGFLWWAKPMEMRDRFDYPLSVRAVSWSREYAAADDEVAAEVMKDLMTNEDRWRQYGDRIDPEEMDKLIDEGVIWPAGIAITLYADRDHYLSVTQQRREDLSQTPDWAFKDTESVPIVPFHLTPWHFNSTFDGNEIDENDEPTAAAEWWTMTQTTFRLMQQRISARHHERPHRAQRREARAAGLPYEPEIVVVRLRREASETSEDHVPGEASYSHRFIVSGHWRNQPYPSEGIHRQIWISPYVKGPEDKPLIVRPRRVYQWER